MVNMANMVNLVIPLRVFGFAPRLFTNDAFLACPAPNYGNSLFGAGRFVRFSAISSPTGGLC